MMGKVERESKVRNWSKKKIPAWDQPSEGLEDSLPKDRLFFVDCHCVLSISTMFCGCGYILLWVLVLCVLWLWVLVLYVGFVVRACAF